MRADGDRQAEAWLEGHDLLPIALTPPHFAPASDHVPNFFDCSMRNGTGDLASAELEVGHASTWKSEEDADVRAVWRNDCGMKR